MELKCTNPNGEIVLEKALNHIEHYFFKIVKIAFRNESYKWFISGRCSKCPKYKIVHNFLITNPNGNNQRFTNRQKYNLQEKNQKRKSNFCKFVFAAPFFVFELIWA